MELMQRGWSWPVRRGTTIKADGHGRAGPFRSRGYYARTSFDDHRSGELEYLVGYRRSAAMTHRIGVCSPRILQEVVRLADIGNSGVSRAISPKDL